MFLINVYHGGQILNTSTGVGYDIRAACIFSTDEIINLRDLKRHIHTGLELLPSQFSINISAQINTTPAGSGVFFIAYLGLFLMKFGEWLKQQLHTNYPSIKILELVVESEPIFGSDNYDPTSISGSSNPVMAEERTHSQLESNDHPMLQYKMWTWMWMRMTKRKSDTWMSRRITFMMKHIWMKLRMRWMSKK
jgi:hypothetical protein